MTSPTTPAFSKMPENWADDMPSDDDVPPPPPEKPAPGDPQPWHGEEWRCAAEERGGFFPFVTPPSPSPGQEPPGGDEWKAAAETRGGFFPFHASDYNWAARMASPMPAKQPPSETASMSSLSETSSTWCSGMGHSIHTPVSACMQPPMGWMSHDMLRWVGPVPHVAPTATPPLHMNGGGISPVLAKRGRAARRTSKAGSSVSGEEKRTTASSPQPSATSAPPPPPPLAGMEGVRKLLNDAGFGQYAEAFDSAGLDRIDLLASATDEELKECGVKPVHRRRILQAAQKWEKEAKEEPAVGPNPLMLMPTPTHPRSAAAWTEQQEKAAEEWLRLAAESQGARICIVGCKYQHESSTLTVRYVSADGGVVPRLAPLLRAAQDYFLCRVWMGPAKEIEAVLQEQQTSPPLPPQDPRLNPLSSEVGVSAASLQPRPEESDACEVECGSDKGGRSRSAPAALRQTTVC